MTTAVAVGVPRIDRTKQNQLRGIFRRNPRLSLTEAGVEVGAHHTTVCHFLKKELKLFSYMPQIAPRVAENDKLRRISFSRDYRRNLRNDSRFLERIVFSDECELSVSGVVDKQKYRI